MQLSEFDYNLPSELIATEPTAKRDAARLLVLNKQTGATEHRHFFDLLDYLRPGDLLIANNSKVIPARLSGKKTTGGIIEIFLSKNLGTEWEVLIKGRVQIGSEIILSDKLKAKITKAFSEGVWLISFNLSGKDLMDELDQIGQVPLPPYIVKARQGQAEHQEDKNDYQTVYADESKKGSVAAPTAGLHFTPELIAQIKAAGVGVEYLTLHVGLGTFLPVKTDKIEEHKIHSEWAELDSELIEKIIKAKRAGRRVIAVGTTSARALEYTFSHLDLGDYLKSKELKTKNFSAWVDIFIYPPYQFKVVDALITNFHLPKSTLLMLVSSLAGQENIKKAYQEAIDHKYRFYSYGDAMLIA